MLHTKHIFLYNLTIVPKINDDKIFILGFFIHIVIEN